MKVMHIHAHFDDYEFAAAGLFELWRRRLSSEFEAKVVICTDGQAGHHFRSRTETGRMRMEEQSASARIGGYAVEVLRYPDTGEVPREGCLELNPRLLAALWRSIRAFEPDYIFCPPVPVDPLAGVHVDHVVVAEAVRRVAYLINVPHVFTPEVPEEEGETRPVKVPVIINDYDSYMTGANPFDLAIDVEEAFDMIRDMTYCHQSQINEWLPWVGRHRIEPAGSVSEWEQTLRARFDRKNRELAIDSAHAFEVFTVTAWGAIPTLDQIRSDLPGIAPEWSRLERLGERLSRWDG